MKKLLSALVLGISFASSAIAADLIEPPVIDAPEPVMQLEQAGGWYIRGDVDYSLMKNRGGEFSVGGVVNPFITAASANTFSIGAGVGYQITNYLRTDLTLDYEFKSKFRGSTIGDCTTTGDPGSCSSVDTSSHSMLLAMANVYADLGNYHGFTPYVGAGLGVANVHWGSLTNAATCTPSAVTELCDIIQPGFVGTTAGGSYTEVHSGVSSWRAAWSLMAGASYDLTSNLKLDAGYKYTRVGSGAMFKYVNGTGTQGYDKGFNLHTVRAGLRYQFGGSSAGCCDGPVYK